MGYLVQLLVDFIKDNRALCQMQCTIKGVSFIESQVNNFFVYDIIIEIMTQLLQHKLSNDTAYDIIQVLFTH